ncbi:MAG: TolC family protein [Phycisphaerales bacterium]|nr:TolC family protein [Phycisphaerales bacterium]MCI0631398.1 TolC family protein [Phycisphaerales bacterium]MCI0677091.1 TolC family protein [Phycisphaerales bacterium]
MTIKTTIAPIAACGLALTSCNLFREKNYLSRPITPEELTEIQSMDVAEQSQKPPVSVEQATDEILKQIVEPPPAPATLEITLADVRAAAIRNNLDIAVEVFSPEIAELTVDVERARFESTFTASARRTIFDSPTELATESSQATIDDFDLGVNVPLRTGGTARVNFPFSRSETNNAFSLLNPAYESDLVFSISQPLLRNAWVNTNTHFIRVAQYESEAVAAQTKLAVIRILADADRVYWRLYASRGELEVRQRQYELAVKQLEQARRRVETGDAAEIEVTRAESGVASSLQGIIIAQTAISRSQRSLKLVMNRPDLPQNSVTQLITATKPEPLGLDLDPNALAAFAVANRMEMLELELRLAADASAIDYRRNQMLPLVTLDYTYAINGLGSSFGNAVDQMSEVRFEDWSLAANVEVPLGNEAAESLYAQAVLLRLQRLATKDQRREAIRREVFDALDLLHQAWQSILAARLESLLAGRTYEGEQRQFEVGERTSTDVLNATANLADAQSREVIALAEYQIALIDIAFATGTLLGHDRVRWQPEAATNGN